uniref:Uncharacterized protein n=1 Tax=Panagrolaimus sp. PS1159 TaxID=55785 RepID=A0AC35GDW9_9BILA
MICATLVNPADDLIKTYATVNKTLNSE